MATASEEMSNAHAVYRHSFCVLTDNKPGVTPLNWLPVLRGCWVDFAGTPPHSPGQKYSPIPRERPHGSQQV